MAALWTGRYHSGALLSAAGADAATAGRFWIVNHLASGLALVVRKIFLTASTPVVASLPQTRITVERMSFTGTPSGAVGVPAPDDSAEVITNLGVSVRTASTGMTPAAGAVIGAGFLGVCVTAAGVAPGVPRNLIFDGSQMFRPGEGLVIRQADAGDVNKPYSIDVEFAINAFQTP